MDGKAKLGHLERSKPDKAREERRVSEGKRSTDRRRAWIPGVSRGTFNKAFTDKPSIREGGGGKLASLTLIVSFSFKMFKCGKTKTLKEKACAEVIKQEYEKLGPMR